jgi:N6-adenosine-specific RNA methylase IME4
MKNKKYQIIYADPPWMYNDKRTHKSTGMALSAYNCMEIENIKSLPINKITDDNCVLFLWTTFPKLKQGIEVLEFWGFKYITVAFVWVKQNPKNDKIYSGIGHWTNANAEIVLLGKKGKIARVEKNVKQIVLSHRGKHSVKPSEVRDRIIRLVGDLPRIELFAREKIKGWDIIKGKDNSDGTGKDIIKWINKNYD